MTHLSSYVCISTGDRIVGSRVFEALHRDREDLGLDLPVLLASGSMAVFGTWVDLHRWRRTGSAPVVASDLGAFVSAIDPVPGDSPHVAVKRIRIDKFSPSEIRRRDARTERLRAEGKSAMDDEAVERRREVWRRRAEATRRPADLMIRSTSTAQTLPLWIDLEITDPVAGKYSTYGLSRSGSTVPLVEI